MEKQVVSKEPWWAIPPEIGQNELEVEWGYLVRYYDGSWGFDNTRPSDEEIIARKGCRILVS